MESHGNPNLGPLAYNGGPTPTEALLPGSAAIGLGLANICLLAPINDLDQRGVSRLATLVGSCDSGAYDGGMLAAAGAINALTGAGFRLGLAASPPRAATSQRRSSAAAPSSDARVA